MSSLRLTNLIQDRQVDGGPALLVLAIRPMNLHLRVTISASKFNMYLGTDQHSYPYAVGQSCSFGSLDQMRMGQSGMGLEPHLDD